MLKMSSVRSFLWFSLITLISMAFPLQVFFKSPYPSLLPYFILTIILLVSIIFPCRDKLNYVKRSLNRPATILIVIYLITTVGHSLIQSIFGLIPLVELLSILVIYSLPVLFYFVVLGVRAVDLNSILISIAVLGFLVGVFSVYDAHHAKNGIVSEYSKSVFEYIVQRKSGDASNANPTRVTPGYRSGGLLEMHAVSAAWISFSAFAVLSFIRKEALLKRGAVIVAYGAALFYFENFTAIFGFFVTLLLVEFHVFELLFLGAKKRVLRYSIIKMMFSSLLVLAMFMLFDSEFINQVTNLFSNQIEIAAGKSYLNSQGVSTTYFSGMINLIISFPNNMSQYPIGFLIGDGFASSFGVIKKGGDYGLIETLYKFGVFLSSLFIIGFCVLTYVSMKLLASYQFKGKRYLYFSITCIIYVILNDIHYSIWCTKSILPILFISLALQQRTVISKDK